MIKAEDKKFHQFKNNPFTSSFAQKISTYVENSNNNESIFNNYFASDEINENVGSTNKITPYSMLIDILKEMTNNLEGHK